MIKLSCRFVVLLALVLSPRFALAQMEPECLETGVCECTITAPNSQIVIQGQNGFIGATRWRVGREPPAPPDDTNHLFLDAIALFQLPDAQNEPTSGDPIELALTGLDLAPPTAITFSFATQSILDDPSVEVTVSFTLTETIQASTVESQLVHSVTVQSTDVTGFVGRLFSYQDYDLDGTPTDWSVSHVPPDPNPESIIQDADAAMTTSVEVEVTDVSLSSGGPSPDTEFEVSLNGVLGKAILEPGNSGLVPELDNLPPPSGPADFEFAYSWQQSFFQDLAITAELTKTLTTALPPAGPGPIGVRCPEPGSGSLAAAALATLVGVARLRRRDSSGYSR